MSGPQTYLSIEDLVQGYSNLFDTVENFYEKLEVRRVFNILEKLRYNLVKKKATKKYGPNMTDKQRSHASLHYQLLGNAFNDYVEYCKDTNVLYNYDIVRVFSQINNDSAVSDSKLMKKHIKKIIELWEAQPDKNDLSKVYEYILEFYSPFKVQSYDGSFKSVTIVLQQKIRYNEFSINDFSNFMYNFCKFMTEDSVFHFLFEERGAIKKRTKRKNKGKTSKKEESKKKAKSKGKGKKDKTKGKRSKANGKDTAKRYTGGYKTEQIAKMFNDLEIAHDSLTIDTLLLYDSIDPELNQGDTTYKRMNNVVKIFFDEYKKKFNKFNIDRACDNVMEKLNEFDLDDYISRDHTMFSNPNILIERFKQNIAYPRIDRISMKEDELMKEYKTLNGLNVETPDINMSKTFDSTNLYDLRLRDLRYELHLSNRLLSYLRRNITGNYEMFYQNQLGAHQPRDDSVPLMESFNLNLFLRRSTDVFFEIQCILVNFMKLYISAIQPLHSIIKSGVRSSNAEVLHDSLLKLLVVHRFLTLHRDGIYTEDPIIYKALNIESPDSINTTLSNLELTRNDDFMMLLMNIYRLMERVKDSIRAQKGDISRRMEGVPTDYDVEFDADIEDRLSEEGMVVRDAVPKDSFYNVLLPDTIVREVDPDSRHICLKKSSEWTKENPKYLMMNLKTKKRSEIEFDDPDLKPGSKVALKVICEWQVERNMNATSGDKYLMKNLKTGQESVKTFPSPNLEISNSQMRNNVSETIRMNTNDRIDDQMYARRMEAIDVSRIRPFEVERMDAIQERLEGER